MWKFYAKDGTLLNKRYYHKGKDWTEQYAILKKVAADHIEEKGIGSRRMTKREKRVAIRRAQKELLL